MMNDRHKKLLAGIEALESEYEPLFAEIRAKRAEIDKHLQAIQSLDPTNARNWTQEMPRISFYPLINGFDGLSAKLHRLLQEHVVDHLTGKDKRIESDVRSVLAHGYEED